LAALVGKDVLPASGHGRITAGRAAGLALVAMPCITWGAILDGAQLVS